MGHDPCKKNSVQRGIPCCSGKKEALLDVVVVCVVGGCVLLCVRCCVVCVCVLVVVCCTHSQDHGIHIHTDVHVGVPYFAH